MTVTITRIYDTNQTANAVISELKAIAIDADDISVVANSEMQGGLNDTDATVDGDGSGAGTGAGIGGAIGGGAGLLAGLGLMAIPGVGPLVAAGWLATTAAGAAAGAATGGLIGALTDTGMDADEANAHAEAVRRGSVMISARVADADMPRVTAIMDRHSPSDMRMRSAAWKADGWTEYDPNARPYSRSEMLADQQRYG